MDWRRLGIKNLMDSSIVEKMVYLLLLLIELDIFSIMH